MLKEAAKEAFGLVETAVDSSSAELEVEEISTVRSVSGGTAEISGMENVQMEELLEFSDGVTGMAFTLSEDSVGAVFLTRPDNVKAGDRVYRTGRVVDIPVGEELLGRVIDPLGRPLDGKGVVSTAERYRIEREAYPQPYSKPSISWQIISWTMHSTSSVVA